MKTFADIKTFSAVARANISNKSVSNDCHFSSIVRLKRGFLRSKKKNEEGESRLKSNTPFAGET